MGSDADSPCQTNPICANSVLYSDRSAFYNNPSRRNTDAIDMTAVSVAHYREGMPQIAVAESCFDGYDNDGDGGTDAEDPDCAGTYTELPPPPSPPPVCDSLTKPFHLNAFLVAQCNIIYGITFSHYRVFWKHHCTGGVDYYQIWKEQPVGSGYVFGWTEFNNQTDAVIQGSPGRIKVTSCGPAGCSFLSDDSVLLIDQC